MCKPFINAAAFVEAELSSKKGYIGEQLVYTFRLFHRIDAKNLNLQLPFDSKWFHKENLGEPKAYIKIINGIQYHVQELSMAIFPLMGGLIDIPASIIELDLLYKTQNRNRQDPFSQFFNDPFFSQRTRAEHKVLRTKPISIKVLPLPAKGKPKNLKNTIGSFDIISNLGKNDLEVGDTTTLTITVSGNGNLRGVFFPEPNLKNLFKVYPDQPEFNQTVRGNQITGKKVFKFALVPLKPGAAKLPAFTFSYFDPTVKDYRQAQTNPIEINVRPSSSQETLNLVQSNSPSNVITKPEIEILAEDILPLHTKLDDFNNINTKIGISTVLEFTYPAIFFLICAFFIRQKKRLTTDMAFYRSQKAYKTASQKLKSLTRSKNIDSKEFTSELSEILREYIGDKLNMKGKAITAAEVEYKLKKLDYQINQVNIARNLLEKCDTLQYAPEVFGNNQELLNETQGLIKILEKKS